MSDRGPPKIVPHYGFRLRDAFTPRCQLIGTCWRCRKTHELDGLELIARLGPNFYLTKLESKLKCRGCGSRFVTVRAEWL